MHGLGLSNLGSRFTNLAFPSLVWGKGGTQPHLATLFELLGLA